MPDQFGCQLCGGKGMAFMLRIPLDTGETRTLFFCSDGCRARFRALLPTPKIIHPDLSLWDHLRE